MEKLKWDNRLTPDEEEALKQFMADYRDASFRIRGFRSGLPKSIAAALIQAGWRKYPALVRGT